MKAVIYHADGVPLWPAAPGTYEKLFHDFVENARPYVEEVIHLTLAGFPHWGTQTIAYEGLNPKDSMYNREVCFTKFLQEERSDDLFWFTEPDARIKEAFPSMDPEIDIVLLWRNDDVHITPSFRICTRKALPLFERALALYDMTRKDWHGDSEAFNRLYDEMGRPGIGCFTWNHLSIELRDYNDYSQKNSRYVTHHKFSSKRDLL